MVQHLPAVGFEIWHSLGACIALLTIALVLREAGVIRWLALQVAWLGRGLGYFLFGGLVMLGAVVALAFGHYATALVVLPIAVELLLVLEVGPAAIVAIVTAIGFMAHVASLPLMISNWVNLMAADYFRISFGRYALVMVPVGFVAIATSFAVLWFYFQRYVPRHYPYDRLDPPASAIRDPLILRHSVILLPLLWLGCGLAAPLGLPIALVPAAIALFLLAIAGRCFNRHTAAILSPRQIVQAIPWRLILVGFGVHLIIIGLHLAGSTALLSQLLSQLAHWGLTLTTLGSGFLAALLAAILNQLPAVWLESLALQSLPNLDPGLREATIYANIIGCGLGGAIAPFSSLATLTWMKLLARHKLRVSWWPYIRINLALTLPVLLVVLLTLTVWLPWLRV